MQIVRNLDKVNKLHSQVDYKTLLHWTFCRGYISLRYTTCATQEQESSLCMNNTHAAVRNKMHQNVRC
jgi:hypothetical protein